MIWLYDIDFNICNFLRNELPINSLKSTINPTTLSNKAKKGDLVLFFNYKHSKLYDSLIKKEISLFPEPNIVHFTRNRATQLQTLDKISNFPLKRIYIANFSGFPEPKINLPIMKTGDNHQGIGKYKYPNKPSKILHNESLVYEEFISNHRAIRILLINNDIFIIEHINDDTWIKNINPDKELTYHFQSQKEEVYKSIPNIDKLINDATNIKNHLNTNLIGIDYAINNYTIGLLEANDMVGIPENQIAETAFQNLLLEICQKHLSL